jgi:N-formylglutamate amidohydrolase
MNRSVIIHIPHSSTTIPKEFLSEVLLSPEELYKEVTLATDLYCDELFGVPNCRTIVAPYSRLACDVERFRDDNEEPCAAKGQGAFYTHTRQGKRLRSDNSSLRQKALESIYDPHHLRLTKLVDETIEECGSCIIVDGHSFCNDAIVGENLPDFCIGTDAAHTPALLKANTESFFSDRGYSAAINYPYSGALVPLKHYKKDNRVHSIMIEVNKRLYLENETRNKLNSFEKANGILTELIQLISSWEVTL